MQWVQSNGGPLILLPEAHLGQWHGNSPESELRATHYDRACSVADELAVLQIGGIETLVLGDEPFQTTWIPHERGALLIRWICADSEQSIFDFLEAQHLQEILQPCCFSFFTPGPCVLFDSAEPGSDIRGGFLRIPLAAGGYELMSASVGPSRELQLLIHQLAFKS